MAKFDATITQGEVAPRIFTPPTDTTTAQAITSLGQAGLAAATGKVKADLETGIEDAVEQFYNSNTNFEGAEANVAGLQEEASASISAGEVDNDVVQDFGREFAKLKTAKAQGRISSAALSMKVEGLIKQASVSFPGLVPEFQTLASQTLGTYNTLIKTIQAQEKSTAAGAAAVQKEMDKLAFKTLPPSQWTTYRSNPEALAEINTQWKVDRDAAQAEQQHNFIQNTRNNTRENTIPLFQSVLTRRHTGIITDFLQTVRTTVPGAENVQSLEDLSNPEFQQQVGIIYDNFAQEALSSFKSGWTEMNDSDFDGYKTALETMGKSLKPFLDGTTTAKNVRDTLNAMKDGDTIRMMGNESFRKAIALAPIGKNLPVVFSNQIAADAVRAAEDVMLTFGGGNSNSGATQHIGVRSNAFTEASGDWLGKLFNSTDTDEVDDVIKEGRVTGANAIVESIQPENINIRSLDQYTKAMSDPASADWVKANPGFKGDEYSRQIAQNFTKTIRSINDEIEVALGAGAGFTRAPAAKIRIDATSNDGKISFVAQESTDPVARSIFGTPFSKVAIQWNRKYMDRLNNTIRSIAHASGNKGPAAYRAARDELIAGGVFNTFSELTRQAVEVPEDDFNPERLPEVPPQAERALREERDPSRERRNPEEDVKAIRNFFGLDDEASLAPAKLTLELRDKVAAAPTLEEKLNILEVDAGLSKDQIRNLMESVGLNSGVLR